MDIETYGGKCPKCEKSMLQKGDTGIGSWFSYDACVWCGFAYGSVDNKQYKESEIWDILFDRNEVKNREELIQTLHLPAYVSKEESEFYPSVFHYSMETLKKIEELNNAK